MTVAWTLCVKESNIVDTSNIECAWHTAVKKARFFEGANCALLTIVAAMPLTHIQQKGLPKELIGSGLDSNYIVIGFHFLSGSFEKFASRLKTCWKKAGATFYMARQPWLKFMTDGKLSHFLDQPILTVLKHMRFIDEASVENKTRELQQYTSCSVGML